MLKTINISENLRRNCTCKTENMGDKQLLYRLEMIQNIRGGIDMIEEVK